MSTKTQIKAGSDGDIFYRASHIILDYLRSLTPKYAHYTKKIYHFLQKKNLLALLNFSK